MIVQFFNRGTGGGEGTVDYLLGKDRDREQAKLLRGHDQETVELINSLDFDKRYTSGCLSFEEYDIDVDLKRQLMDEFEETLFPGLDKHQYSVLWVEHRDKERLELNFVIPNVELTSGKRLQPYYVGADYHRVDAWKQIKNIEHGFADPDDPARAQSMTLSKDLPADKKIAVEIIHQAVETAVLSGVIKHREDVVQYLEEVGMEIARETKQSISIKDPDGGRNIRLKGTVYERDFKFSREIATEIKERSGEYQSRIGERLSNAQERYQYGIEKRRAYLEQRYRGVDREITVTFEGTDRESIGTIQALSESSRELARSIITANSRDGAEQRTADSSGASQELSINGDLDLQNVVNPVGGRLDDLAWNDRIRGLSSQSVKGYSSRYQSSEADVGSIGRSDEWDYDQELYGREWRFTMRRTESEFQRAELDGRKNRGNASNYQYEEVENDNGNTAVIIERLNGFNERVSEAKRRMDRERESADQRLRAIAERSDHAKRNRTEYAKVVHREFTEESIPGVASDIIDRSTQELKLSIDEVNVIIEKIKNDRDKVQYEKNNEFSLGM